MERLNDIGATESARLALRKQLVRKVGVPAYEVELSSQLPVGSFLLSEEDDDDSRIVDATSSPTVAPAGEMTTLPGTTLPRLQPNRGRERVVDSLPPTAQRSHPFVMLLPPTGGVLPAPQPAPAQSCSLCKDRGYLRADVPFGHPQFGKLVECKCRQAKKNEAQRLVLREQSKLDDLVAFQEESFETFQLWLLGVQEAYDAALHFAETRQGWLVLAGGNGCGKTHLAVAIAKRCLEDGATVLFAVVPDLLDYLRSTFAPTAEETYDEEFRKMREAEVLILDDLGSEQSTGWATEKLFQLLNYRYNARLATVFTTNKMGFEGIAPRLRSRLSDRRLVRTVTLTEAQDFREMEPGQ